MRLFLSTAAAALLVAGACLLECSRIDRDRRMEAPIVDGDARQVDRKSVV